MSSENLIEQLGKEFIEFLENKDINLTDVEVSKLTIDYFTMFGKESNPFHVLIIEDDLRYIINCVGVQGNNTNNRLDQLETLVALYNTLVSKIGEN